MMLNATAESMVETDLVGRRVRVHGVSRPELNGRAGTVEDYRTQQERYVVQLDGDERALLMKRANLQMIDDEEHSELLDVLAPMFAPSAKEDAAAAQRGPMGRNTERLDELRASIRSGFNFITGLAMAERQLLHSASSAYASWSIKGLSVLVRGVVTEYERGALAESCATFEAVLHVIKEHASCFQAEDEAMTKLVQDFEAGMRYSRPETPPTLAIITALAQACIRMQPAHEYAAKRLAWSRHIGFGDRLQPPELHKAVTVKPLAECWSSAGTGPMFEGWRSVLDRARCEGAASRPFDWPALCECESMPKATLSSRLPLDSHGALQCVPPHRYGALFQRDGVLRRAEGLAAGRGRVAVHRPEFGRSGQYDFAPLARIASSLRAAAPCVCGLSHEQWQAVAACLGHHFG